MNIKTLKRTPLSGTKLPTVSGRSRKPRQSVMYQKFITMRLTGTDPAKIQQVASDLHRAAGSITMVKGGKESRLVHIMCQNSTDPEKIFDGLIE